ncbi:FliM/FliN family flagellar motor switch protein [Achromobacter sp. AGC78]
MTTHQGDIAHVMAQPIDYPEGEQAAADQVPLAIRNLNPIHNVKATLSVRVGDVELTVGDLINAKTAQVFALDRRVDQPVDLLLEGSVVARGELVAVGDHFGVRIIELPLDLRSLA